MKVALTLLLLFVVSTSLRAIALEATLIENEKGLKDYLTRNTDIESNYAKTGRSFATYEKLTESVFPIIRNLDGEEDANGTGFFISDDGYFVTTYHGLDECLILTGRETLTEHSTPIDCINLKKGNQIVDFSVSYRGKTYATKIVSHIKREPIEERLDKLGGVPREQIRELAGTPFDQLSSVDLLIGKIDLPAGVRVPAVKLAGPIEAITNQPQSVHGSRPPERLYAVGYRGPTRPVTVSAGCATVKVQSFYEGAHGELPRTLGMVSAGMHWERLKREQAAEVSRGRFPKTDLNLVVFQGLSGGPAINLFGDVEGICLAGDERGSVIASVNQLIHNFFTKHETRDPLVTLPLEERVARAGKEPEVVPRIFYLKR